MDLFLKRRTSATRSISATEVLSKLQNNSDVVRNERGQKVIAWLKERRNI